MGPVAPARRAWPIASLMNRPAPQAVLADPLRCQLWRTSPASARVSSIGSGLGMVVAGRRAGGDASANSGKGGYKIDAGQEEVAQADASNGDHGAEAQ